LEKYAEEYSTAGNPEAAKKLRDEAENIRKWLGDGNDSKIKVDEDTRPSKNYMT